MAYCDNRCTRIPAMMVEAFFSQIYDEARDKSLAAAQTRGLRIKRHLCPDAVGLSGEQLSIGAALLVSTQTQTLLIFTSGAHGVEGFCDSSCRTGLLQGDKLFARLVTAKVVLLLTRVVSPYGLARL